MSDDLEIPSMDGSTKASLRAECSALRAERDALRASHAELVAALKLAQSLMDDADQGPRGAVGDGEWRIPWSRHAVEVFSNIAVVLANAEKVTK